MHNEAISIYVVDDSEVIRLGVTVAFQKDASLKMVGDAGTGAKALAEIEATQPDIVLLDRGLPDMDGLDLVAQIHAISPQTKIVILTMHDDKAAIFEAFERGVVGYCNKGVRMEWLIPGIKTVAQGGKWMGPRVIETLLTAASTSDERRPAERVKPINGPLSSREQEVLALLTQGFSNVEIGRKLFLSPETIKTHVRHITEKMSVRDRTHAAVEAVRRGLVQAC